MSRNAVKQAPWVVVVAPRSPYDRVIARRVIDEETGCWRMKGATNGFGHRQVRVKKNGKWKKDYAHRISYEHHKGAIPKGKVVRHKCDVPDCFNPDHLCLGSAAENNMDTRMRQRAANQYGPYTSFVETTEDFIPF